jgi:hypothetical protein
MPTKDTHQPIRILHLSDIHFRLGKAWDADPVLRALARFIRTEVENGLAPDLVMFTGDMAFSGSAEEYELARQWLDTQLWPALAENLPRDRLLLIPGNHDVDRLKVRTGVRSIQDGLLRERSPDGIAAVLGDDDERSIVMKRHAAYLDFVESWLGQPQPFPWWQRVFEIGETRLHVAGLNSAWMCSSDEDRGRLLLSRYQLTRTVETEEAEGAHWRIVLVHHPWDYLAEFDLHDARSLIHQHADLLLRGHLHAPSGERVLPPDPWRHCLELGAGCVYSSSQYPNAFQWIELSPDGKLVRVRFRAWLRNAWTIDRNQAGCHEGFADFELSRERPSRQVSKRTPAPEIPTEYLDWLWRRHARVELLGQDVKTSHALTLSHVYVPALTQPDEVVLFRRNGEKIMTRGAREWDEPVPVLERINERSLYLSAPAGAGKSTFCRWAALQSIPGAPTSHPIPVPKEYEEPVPTTLRSRLPLLIPLRDFCHGMECGRGCRIWHRGDLEQALATWIDRAPPPGLNGGLLIAHLAAGSAFLLLDGLDEVPVSEFRSGGTVYPRELLLSGLADALAVWEPAGNLTLLTSRPYGLDEAGLAGLGLPRASLEPLPEPLQNVFVTRWFHTLKKQELTAGLIHTIHDRDDLAPLAENPMLLTAICVLYDKGGRLPEDRYELYKSIVDGVLHGRFRADALEREPVLRRLEAIAYGMHTGEPGGTPRQTPAAEISWHETERLLAHFAEQNPAYGRGEVDAAVQREELLTRSGLLLPRPNERATFYHLSFQEFLAAQRIARGSEKWVTDVIGARADAAEWRPTLLFLFAAQLFNKEPEWGLDVLGQLLQRQERAAVEANSGAAVFIANALELCLAKGYRIPDALAENFRCLSLHAIEDEVEVQARQALGLCLGRLGDPRIASLRDAGAYVEVPAGPYPSGDNGETVEITAPFWIGRYPVTNSQYREFLDDGGYGNRDWWSAAGWAWLHEEGATEPAHWQETRWNGPNQPVVGVTFWEAEACCAWAGGRLPREQEWEAAAGGPESCEYPWCGGWEDGICNTPASGLGMTSPVGLFPRSRQAQLGIEDLAGNVLEWCATPSEDADRPRALHGGSYTLDQDLARCAGIFRILPSIRGAYYVGFRVVCASSTIYHYT